MAHLPQPARGGRSIAAGGFVRPMAKSAVPDVQAPTSKNAVPAPSAAQETELLASEAEA